MQIIRHPELAEDVHNVTMHYAEVSERILAAFWNELDSIITSIEKHPESHHFDSCGLRRANFRKFPYHLLYEVENHRIFLLVLRHNRRHPNYGLDRYT